MILYNLFIQLWLFLNFFTTTFCLYQFVVALAGIHRNKKYACCEKKHRFAAIISARNEEYVIGNLIESLKLQNYPQELLDIIVIADNCTDSTAEVAQKAGAIVYKRFNKTQIGKGYALKFAFEKIFAERDIYDAFCIFDADNLVDRNFFSEMNDAFGAGYEVAQGYRDMKNPSDNWITGGNSIFYWMENRFFNSARTYLGLSATINGTAYMMTAKLLKEIGYNPKTCTEDIEFTVQSILAGRRIGWVPNAKVYDEQPVSFSQSISQRFRWVNGLIQCYRSYAGTVAKKIIDRPDWITIDLFMYLMSFPVMIFGMLASIMCFVFVILRIFDPMGTVLNFALLGAGAFASFWIIALATLLLEKKATKEMFVSVLAYPIFSATWIPIYIICLFKRKVEWKPIIHIRNLSLSDIESKTKI